jgi:hypothetical protein
MLYKIFIIFVIFVIILIIYQYNYNNEYYTNNSIDSSEKIISYYNNNNKNILSLNIDNNNITNNSSIININSIGIINKPVNYNGTIIKNKFRQYDVAGYFHNTLDLINCNGWNPIPTGTDMNTTNTRQAIQSNFKNYGNLGLKKKLYYGWNLFMGTSTNLEPCSFDGLTMAYAQTGNLVIFSGYKAKVFFGKTLNSIIASTNNDIYTGVNRINNPNSASVTSITTCTDYNNCYKGVSINPDITPIQLIYVSYIEENIPDLPSRIEQFNVSQYNIIRNLSENYLSNNISLNNINAQNININNNNIGQENLKYNINNTFYNNIYKKYIVAGSFCNKEDGTFSKIYDLYYGINYSNYAPYLVINKMMDSKLKADGLSYPYNIINAVVGKLVIQNGFKSKIIYKTLDINSGKNNTPFTYIYTNTVYTAGIHNIPNSTIINIIIILNTEIFPDDTVLYTL